MTGIPDSQLSSGNFDGVSLLHPDDREKVGSTLYDALKGKTPFTVFFRLKHHDGHIIPVRFNGWFISERYENRYPVFYGIYTDLSQVPVTFS